MNAAPDTYLALFLRFLRFGFLAWGGPVAQIAMLREELVEKEQWITPEKFKRALAVYQALPGPEAHELCVYFGMVRKGRLGGFLAGLGFMLPGFLLILLIAKLYTFYGPAVLLPLFAGFSPAVTALIVRATHRIGMHTLDELSLWIIAAASIVLTVLQIHFFWVFIISASTQALWARGLKHRAAAALIFLSIAAISITFLFSNEGNAITLVHGGLFVEGLKAGLLSFGGAYTAIPFLNDSMVGEYPDITQQTFLDGIALSNVIPAPLVIFGTFLGYLADGLSGAALVTLGIFIPAFSFTLLGHNYLEKAIENPSLHGSLNGIAAAVVGLLAVTSLKIAATTITGIYPLFLFIIALVGLYKLRGKWSVPLVIIGCGALGWLLNYSLSL